MPRNGIKTNYTFYKLLCENSIDIITVLTDKGEILFESPSIKSSLGYEDDELVGKIAFDYVHPDDLQRVIKTFQECLKYPKSAFKVRFRFKHKNGKWHYFESIGKNYCSNPNINGVLVNSRDVTLNIELEEMVQKEKEYYQTILKNINDGLAVVNPDDGKFLDVNDKFVEMLGYPIDEILRLRVCDISKLLNTPAKWKKHIEADLNNENGFLIKDCIVKKEGKMLDVEVSVKKISRGKNQLLLAVVRDISSRDETERALFSALHAASNSIIITDIDGIIEYVNPAFIKTTGYNLTEAIGERVSIIKSGKHNQKFYQKLWDTIKSKQTWRGTITNRRKDGTLFQEKTSITPVTNEKGEIEHFIAIKSELTEQLKMEELLKDQEKELMKFQKLETLGGIAGSVAHDFNNLLTAIIGYAELIHEMNIPNLKMNNILSNLVDAALNGKELTARMLNYSRDQVNDQQEEILNDIIADLLPLLNRLIPKSIKLNLKLTPKANFIFCNKNHIEQLIMNLIINAKDAICETGEITLTTDVRSLPSTSFSQCLNIPKGEYICLTVKDSGIGIDSKVMRRLFDPFFSTKEKGKGTGLGLPIVKNIVRNHKGYICIHSKPLKGTVFEVLFPAKKVESS